MEDDRCAFKFIKTRAIKTYLTRLKRHVEVVCVPPIVVPRSLQWESFGAPSSGAVAGQCLESNSPHQNREPLHHSPKTAPALDTVQITHRISHV